MISNPLATSGNDQLYGTAIPDYFEALEGDDVVFGGGGGDTIGGGLGNDTVYADTYAGYVGADAPTDLNFLFGDAGDDTLVGGIGTDDLWGGTGNDVMMGGAGEDWFVFEPGSGLDIITDFTPGEDQIMVMANMNGTGDPTLSQNQDGVVVNFGSGNVAVLAGMDLASLPADAIVPLPYTDVGTFYDLMA